MEVTLYYTSGSSDKTYRLEFTGCPSSGSAGFRIARIVYEIGAQWGRRGAYGESAVKYVGSDFNKALRTWNNIIREKTGKGYTTDESGTPYMPSTLPEISSPEDLRAITRSSTALVSYPCPVCGQLSTGPVRLCPTCENRGAAVVNAIPELSPAMETAWLAMLPANALAQLPNSITEEELEEIIDDPAWGAQEKFDGKRLVLRYQNGRVTSFNKKGTTCGCPLSFVSAFRNMMDTDTNRVITAYLDGEMVGQVLYVYDFRVEGQRNGDYQERHDRLGHLIDGVVSDVFQFAPLVISDKRAFLARLRGQNKEGIILKRLDSEYRPGRPASGGDQLKFKFVATASCIVRGINDRNSISLDLLDANGDRVDVGNCTVLKRGELAKIAPDTVVEIRYLYAYEGGSLYQPVYLGIRDDIDIEECRMSQLKYKGTDTTATQGVKKPAAGVRRIRWE